MFLGRPNSRKSGVQRGEEAKIAKGDWKSNYKKTPKRFMNGKPRMITTGKKGVNKTPKEVRADLERLRNIAKQQKGRGGGKDY